MLQVQLTRSVAVSIRAVACLSVYSVPSKGARCAALLIPFFFSAYGLLGASPAHAQTPPKATFCALPLGCYDTMEKAADALRNSKDYQGIGQYLKPYSKAFLNRGAGEVWTYFRVPFLKAASVSGPSYGVNLGIYGVGNPGCTASPEFGSSWCTEEGALIAKSLDILTTKLGKSCSLQSSTQTSDYNTTGLGLSSNGDVSYSSDKYFNATFNCLSNSGGTCLSVVALECLQEAKVDVRSKLHAFSGKFNSRGGSSYDRGCL